VPALAARFWQPPLRAYQAEGIAAFILSFYPHMQHGPWKCDSSETEG